MGDCSAFSEMCPRHPSEPIDLYCTTCSTAACPRCFLENHNGHHHDDLRKHIEAEASNQRHTLVSEALSDHIAELEVAATGLRKKEAELRQDCEAITRGVNANVDEICRKVKERGKELNESIFAQQGDALMKVRGCQEDLCVKKEKANSLKERSGHLDASELELQLKELQAEPMPTVVCSSNKYRAAKNIDAVIKDMLGSVVMESTVGGVVMTNVLSKCEKTMKLECPSNLRGLVVTANYICTLHEDDANMWLYDKSGPLQTRCEIPGLKSPKGIALLDEAKLKFVISCYKEKRLHFVRLSSDTLQLAEHDVVGTTFSPYGISISPLTQNIIVAGRSNERVMVYDHNGRELSQLATSHVTISWLLCALQTKDGQYVAVDWNNPGKLLWLDADGRVSHSYGSGPEEAMNSPPYMIQDQAGRLIVADTWNDRLHIITPDKRLQRHLLEGEGIKHPRRLCLDEDDGRLYVGHGEPEEGIKISVFRYMEPTDGHGSETDLNATMVKSV